MAFGWILKTARKMLPARLRPPAKRVLNAAQGLAVRLRPSLAYKTRREQELRCFSSPSEVDKLPAIAEYWFTTHLVPMLQPLGFTSAADCIRRYLERQCRALPKQTRTFLSIGAGIGQAEIDMAAWFRSQGLDNFRFECLDINPALVEQGARAARDRGLADCVAFKAFDINTWRPIRQYDAVLALQSLHHVVELERLFDGIFHALADDGYFLSDDMIGRNGHQRWPEALVLVHELWKDLPDSHKYNQQLRRFEPVYDNWDCSAGSFEGIRAQDILPLLIERFHFEFFFPFGNVVDIFIDRAFGHNFDPRREWDRAFIDRVHEIDMRHLERGSIKPTHMLAVMRKFPPAAPPKIHKHLSPQFCLRSPDALS